MEVTIDQVLSFLAGQGAKPTHLSNRRSRSHNVRLFNETTRFESGTLYVGFGRKLRRDDSLNSSVNAVCIGDIDPSLIEDGWSNANIIGLAEDAELEDVSNALQEFLNPAVSQQHLLQQDNLAYALAGKGLQNILDIGQDLLSNPLYLLHGNYVLIAKSTRVVVPDIICDELHNKGHLTIEEADGYFGEHFLERFRTFSKPRYIESEKLPYNRMLGRVRIGNGDYGCIAAVEYAKTFQPQDYRIMESLCAIIEQELTSDSQLDSINEAKKATLINDLLSGSIRDARHLRLRLKDMDWHPKNSYRLYLLNFSHASDTYLTFFRDAFKLQIPQAEAFIYRESIVLLCEPAANTKQEAELEDKIESLCDVANLRCGISDAIHSLIDVRNAFRQASHVLQTARKLQVPGLVFKSEDFMLLFLIDKLAENSSLDEFIHPTVRAIRDYDAEHESEYGLTLHTYLLRGKDAMKTCDELHIHKNTLSYRLRRLASMHGIDWDDGYLLTQLLISLEILHFNE